ncbi:MAG: lipase [Pirellulaceae bacterium]|nr:alpha/beta hydrolase [Planctomycetales bacterium]
MARIHVVSLSAVCLLPFVGIEVRHSLAQSSGPVIPASATQVIDRTVGETSEEGTEDSVDSRGWPTMGGSQFWSDRLHFHGWRIQHNTFTGHHRLLDKSDRRHAAGSYETCVEKLEQVKQQRQLPPMKGRAVILLHGLGDSWRAMKGLEQYINKRGGFEAFNVSYASTRRRMSDHAATLAEVVANLDGITEINFVGHSMGNIVLRNYLGDLERANAQPPIPIGRIVMIGPPNQGADLARRLGRDTRLYGLIAGDSGEELGTQWEQLAAQLAIPKTPFGIIAGGVGGGTMQGNPVIDGTDDLIVSVEETKLPGAADFMVLPVFHSQLPKDERVHGFTYQFLKTGYFVDLEHAQPLSVDESTALPR